MTKSVPKGRVRRLVLDVLKPHEPSIISLSQQLSNLKGVSGVDLTVISVDRKVENARLTIEGEDVNPEQINKIIQDNGCTIKSIDKVSAGIKTVHQPYSLMRE